MVPSRRQQSVAIPPNGRGSRILIVRLSSIGDVVHGLPLLCALPDALPEAHLAWIVEDWVAVLLEGHSALDEIIRLPRRWFEDSWYRPARFFVTLTQLRRQFGSRGFDVAIDVQGLTKNALTAWMLGARYIGSASTAWTAVSKASGSTTSSSSPGPSGSWSATSNC